jgi:hypothetical protein
MMPADCAVTAASVRLARPKAYVAHIKTTTVCIETAAVLCLSFSSIDDNVFIWGGSYRLIWGLTHIQFNSHWGPAV